MCTWRFVSDNIVVLILTPMCLILFAGSWQPFENGKGGKIQVLFIYGLANESVKTPLPIGQFSMDIDLSCRL